MLFPTMLVFWVVNLFCWCLVLSKMVFKVFLESSDDGFFGSKVNSWPDTKIENRFALGKTT